MQRRSRGRWAWLLAPVLTMAGAGSAHAAVPSTEPEPTTVPIAHPEPAAPSPSAPQRFTGCEPGRRWYCCPPGVDPCIRSRPARALLLALGVLGGAGAAGLLFGLGDRLAGGDPATLFVGTGALAGVGAIVGTVAGWLGADRPGDPDRIRPVTLGLEYGFAGTTVLDEADPHTLAMIFAPTYFFPRGRGRVRLYGHLGGTLWSEKHVDPRPQNDTPISGQEGTSPVTLEQRQLSIGVGLDMAVNLPYPVLSPQRSAFLGPSELRWRPEVQIRREAIEAGGADARIVERTMLLPLTVGMRWHLSPRQRFTIYMGPRFDFVAYSDVGSKDLHRGGVQVGPLYGEAFYDLDVPFTLRPRRDGRPRRARVNGMLSVGYVHSRFDGRGFNFGPVIGFLGPLRVAWHTRVRPTGWPVALQGTVGAWIGNGVGADARIGVVLPDLGRRPR